MRRFAVVLLFLAFLAPGLAAAQSPSSAKTAPDLTGVDIMALVMLVLMDEAKDNAGTLRDLLTEIKANNARKAALIGQQGLNYFVEEALDQFARDIGGSETVHGLVEAILIVVLDPSSRADAQLKAAIAAASDADLNRASKIVDEWVDGVRATTAGAEAGDAGLRKLVANSDRAIDLARAGGSGYGDLDEADIMALIMIVMAEDAQNNTNNLRDLMAEMRERNAKKAGLIEQLGMRYFVEEGLARYGSLVGSNPALRQIVATLIEATLQSPGAGGTGLDEALAGADDADLKMAIDILRDWIAQVHGKAAGNGVASGGVAILLSNGNAVVRLAENAAGDDGSSAGTTGSTLAGGGSSPTGGAGGSAGGSAGYDTVYK